VVNLSPDKKRVLSEAYRVLAPGGEFYFSDVYCDRCVTPRLTLPTQSLALPYSWVGRPRDVVACGEPPSCRTLKIQFRAHAARQDDYCAPQLLAEQAC
jgi:SAM-dependent methyltransferase